MEDAYVEDEPMYTESESTFNAPGKTQSKMFNPFTFALEFVASYGWYVVGLAALLLYVLHRLRPVYRRWQVAREDAEYHKNPDTVRQRLEAVQRTRELQQEALLQASHRAAQQQKEREERKRAEAVERLKKYADEGHRLGSATAEDDYLPLSGGGASTSSYRPPKRSKCGGGGCGR